MITAIFNPGDKSITTKKVMQWDYGQILSIKGLDLPKAVEIHFCVYTDSTTITTVGITTDDRTDVEIPDGLLQQERELRAYVYVADMEQGKTVRTVNIPIQSRQKPEIPHTPEDTEVFRKAIKAVNDSADRAETAANTSEQNAKKTAEDRVAIAEMVETVSGIEQQVQDVKEYAGQARTAASNAALSEQKAKKSETAALQAKADAETAKGSAETAAGKTAEDRTAVESTKEEVLQAKQQVSADRAAVEAVQRNVAQMGNAIPQAVLEGVQAVGSAGAAEKQGIVQAGTEQKSAVESAGTKAVENINLAKKSATDAVETAKTGAVGAVGTAGAEQTQSVTEEGEKQVKAVADKGAEVLQSIPEDFAAQMESKLNKQQGAENNGKILGIGADGNVIPVEKPSGGGEKWRFLRTVTVPADPKTDQSGVVWKLNSDGAVLGFAFDTDENGEPFSVDDIMWCGTTKVGGTGEGYKKFYLSDIGKESLNCYRMFFINSFSLFGRLNRFHDVLYPIEYRNTQYQHIPNIVCGTGNARRIRYSKKITVFGIACDFTTLLPESVLYIYGKE